MQLRHIIYLILSLPAPVGASAQTAARTLVVDTSYTLHSAYKSSVKTNPETRWVSPQPTTAVTVQQNIAYQRYGDRTLVTDVFLPAATGAAKRTAIILIHGGGWRSGNRSLHHPMARQLA